MNQCLQLTVGLLVGATAATASAQGAPNPVIQYPNIVASQAGLSARVRPDVGRFVFTEQSAFWERPGSFGRAARGLSPAQRSVAWALHQRSFDTALAAARALAESGDPWANRQLGWMYTQGLGVAPDSRLAFHFFHAAARSGDAPSALAMGLAYQAGHGVVPDRALSDYWLTRAQQTGDRAVRRDATRLRWRNQTSGS